MGTNHEKITDQDEKDRDDHYNREKNSRFPGAIWAPDLFNPEWVKYKNEVERQLKEEKNNIKESELPQADK